MGVDWNDGMLPLMAPDLQSDLRGSDYRANFSNVVDFVTSITTRLGTNSVCTTGWSGSTAWK